MKPLIVGITGGSGSGKTSFIRKLNERFERNEICIISQDDYYRPRHEQECDEHGIHNFDLPKSIDKKAFIRDIQQLIEGNTVVREEYTFNNHQASTRLLVFQPAPILIIEGIFVFHFRKVRKLLDIKIFLHAKENLKVIRRILRDQAERNYPLDDVLYRYQHHVLPTFEKYIRPYMDDADLVINNNHHFEMGLDVVTGFFKSYLNQVNESAPQPILVNSIKQ